jgi:hypothetical protein
LSFNLVFFTSVIPIQNQHERHPKYTTTRLANRLRTICGGNYRQWVFIHSILLYYKISQQVWQRDLVVALIINQRRQIFKFPILFSSTIMSILVASGSRHGQRTDLRTLQDSLKPRKVSVENRKIPVMIFGMKIHTTPRFGTLLLIPVDDYAADTPKKRTLTNLYNQRPAWPANVCHVLNEAVAAAYG